MKSFLQTIIGIIIVSIIFVALCYGAGLLFITGIYSIFGVHISLTGVVLLTYGLALLTVLFTKVVKIFDNK